MSSDKELFEIPKVDFDKWEICPKCNGEGTDGYEICLRCGGDSVVSKSAILISPA